MFRDEIRTVPKRTVPITVRVTEEDQQLFHQIAARIWPGAILSESGILLGLARLGCKAATEDKKRRPLPKVR
jgi:hypothetical protein